ncbi:collagen alpha-1(I) chain-like [Lepus europaeus]|uniref:collagen alpha-1(I) chain-like n=1 Tax=Lepus europaeus TaxID=9983 RepID=UPI002B496E3A|nr:collagen alpha-1(I) chain-like [Lepus europaeus]
MRPTSAPRPPASARCPAREAREAAPGRFGLQGPVRSGRGLRGLRGRGLQRHIPGAGGTAFVAGGCRVTGDTNLGCGPPSRRPPRRGGGWQRGVEREDGWGRGWGGDAGDGGGCHFFFFLFLKKVFLSRETAARTILEEVGKEGAAGASAETAGAAGGRAATAGTTAGAAERSSSGRCQGPGAASAAHPEPSRRFSTGRGRPKWEQRLEKAGAARPETGRRESGTPAARGA